MKKKTFITRINQSVKKGKLIIFDTKSSSDVFYAFLLSWIKYKSLALPRPVQEDRSFKKFVGKVAFIFAEGLNEEKKSYYYLKLCFN